MKVSEVKRLLEEKKDRLEEALSADVLFISYAERGVVHVEASHRNYKSNAVQKLNISNVLKLIENRDLSQSQIIDMIIDDLIKNFKKLL